MEEVFWMIVQESFPLLAEQSFSILPAVSIFHYCQKAMWGLLGKGVFAHLNSGDA